MKKVVKVSKTDLSNANLYISYNKRYEPLSEETKNIKKESFKVATKYKKELDKAIKRLGRLGYDSR